MSRIIPGVEVKVVKEVVPPQLAPSGVLGLVALTEARPAEVVRVSSWSEFVERLGIGSAVSVPAARQALGNGVFEVVVVPVQSNSAMAASAELVDGDNKKILTLTARAAGPWGNGVSARLTARQSVAGLVYDLELTGPQARKEVHRNLTLAGIADTLAVGSALCTCVVHDAEGTLAPGDYELSGGADATADEYITALAALENVSDVDMVLADVQDFSDQDAVTRIYSEVIGHCDRMSANSMGRLGFGQVGPVGLGESLSSRVDTWSETAGMLVSDRFVYVAPHGLVGAVAGMIGKLSYLHSPTFKTLSGLGALAVNLGVSEQRALLKSNVVPVITQRGRGTIVLRGLTTDGDQVNVRRVADRAVRGVQMLGELFIGRLNNEDGRSALRQKLVEFLVQMEKDGAIVPSTDGSDPAFKCDVYSSQADFAKGIVRVDLAVRPVRAIDYIYATVLVQV